MAQVILTCIGCGEQAGLQFSDERPPEKGCTKGENGLHQWEENIQRVRLVSDVMLPEGADPDGFADSVSDFLSGLDDPSCHAIDTRVEFERPIEIKKVGKDAYDVANIPAGDGTYEDAHINEADGRWTVEVFAQHVEDANEAHRDSQTFDTFQEALDWVLPEE